MSKQENVQVNAIVGDWMDGNVAKRLRTAGGHWLQDELLLKCLIIPD